MPTRVAYTAGRPPIAPWAMPTRKHAPSPVGTTSASSLRVMCSLSSIFGATASSESVTGMTASEAAIAHRAKPVTISASNANTTAWPTANAPVEITL